MILISAIIIAKNEENLIRDCIDTLSFCDEIVLIDNNSKDKTKDIAQSLGAKVYEIDSHTFSEIRNYGQRKASGKWILYIDADERVTKELRENILNEIKTQDYSSYIINRRNFYLGKNEWPFIEKIQRLFKSEDLITWKGVIHETPVSRGNMGTLDGFLDHYTHRDLESMVNKTVAWSTIEAEIRLTSSHPKMSWWRFPRVMLTAFIRSYIFQKGYRAKTVGVIESIYQVFSIFITYAKLWEMQNRLKNSNDK